jgi:hypothetical protein|uniref:Uncharacterized protein n=1 Tax=Siphoviridae sp. ct0eR1 TaxID=2825297 RepID=A0A8S5UHC9_9CAUD|nr:MAG TPA: hypothetical protein [Siphoviridae sp. ct0eR1]
MTANESIAKIKRDISLAQLWLPKPDECDIDEAHMVAHLKWHNQYNGTGIDVTVENGNDDAISKWVIWGWPLSVVGVYHETSGESTSNLARHLARQWTTVECDAIAARQIREINNTIYSILNSPSIDVQDDARSDLMGVLDDIAREHGGNYQRLGL